MQVLAALGDAPTAAIAIAAILLGLLVAARGSRGGERAGATSAREAGPAMLGGPVEPAEAGFVGPEGEVVGHGAIHLDGSGPLSSSPPDGADATEPSAAASAPAADEVASADDPVAVQPDPVGWLPPAEGAEDDAAGASWPAVGTTQPEPVGWLPPGPPDVPPDESPGVEDAPPAPLAPLPTYTSWGGFAGPPLSPSPQPDVESVQPVEPQPEPAAETPEDSASPDEPETALEPVESASPEPQTTPKPEPEEIEQQDAAPEPEAPPEEPKRVTYDPFATAPRFKHGTIRLGGKPKGKPPNQ